jgi:hypothetical protein
MRKPLLWQLTTAAFFALFATACQRQVNDGWESVTSEAGGFSISFSGKHETLTAPLPKAIHPDAPETTISAKLLQCKSSNGLVYYVVGFWDYPTEPSPREIVLDKIVDHILSNKKVETRNDINLGPHPGREFRASYSSEGHTAVGQTRVYLVGRRVYQVGVWGEPDRMKYAEIDRFLRSFRLTALKGGGT